MGTTERGTSRCNRLRRASYEALVELYWQRYVSVFQAERLNFFVPFHEQHSVATFLLDTLVQAAEQAPEEVEPASFRPYVGSMATMLPFVWNWM